MTQLCSLPHRTVIRLSGQDLRDFLQGILTQDIRKLSSDAPVFAAMLTPQSKFLFDFFLYADGDDILLETERDWCESLLGKLKQYRLRSKVALTDESGRWSVMAAWPDCAEDPALRCFRDPRHPALGWRILVDAGTPSPTPSTDATTYDRHRISLGIADGKADATDRSFILDLNYDMLHAISFEKGCYVGQEVVARMHYRHIMRKCIYRVDAEEGATLPPSETPILQGEKPVGEMRSSHGNLGLASLSTDIQEGFALTAGAVRLIPTLPDYMRPKMEQIRTHLQDEESA